MAKRRGRPPFKPTAALRKTVERMMACGDSQNTVARALGVDDDTLRKHFPGELLNGAAKRRREIVDLLFKGAAKGNASLIKRVEEMTRVTVAISGRDGEQSPPSTPSEGKKGLKQAAAERIGGKYAVPAPPKLVVSND